MGTSHQQKIGSAGVNYTVISSLIMFSTFVLVFITAHHNRPTFTPKDLSQKNTWDLKVPQKGGDAVENSSVESDSDVSLGEVASRFLDVKCSKLNTTVSLHIIEGVPSKVKREEDDRFLKDIPVVLLHGAAYSSHTWQNNPIRFFQN